MMWPNDKAKYYLLRWIWSNGISDSHRDLLVARDTEGNVVSYDHICHSGDIVGYIDDLTPRSRPAIHSISWVIVGEVYAQSLHGSMEGRAVTIAENGGVRPVEPKGY